jgi:hypothetical protein
MKNYQEIQKQIDIALQEYIDDLFLVSVGARKYYYWSVDFFETVGGLSFQYFKLDSNYREEINVLGETLFEDKSIIFNVGSGLYRACPKNAHFDSMHEF